MILNTRSHKAPFVILLFILMLLLNGCSFWNSISFWRDKKEPPPKPPKPVFFKRVVIVPFQDMSRSYGENVTVECRLCNRFYTTAKVEAGADTVLTEKMESYIRSRKSLELIPTSQAEGAYSDVLSKAGKDLSELELLVRVGKDLNAEAVIVGKIYRYIERDGTYYSAKTSASVAFDIFLIRVDNGQLLWSGHFDESQQSLFDNILDYKIFVKRKGRWITAEELADEGLVSLLKTFPAP